MCLLVESIKYLDGRFYNVDLHQSRMNNSRKAIFGLSNPLSLDNYLKSMTCPPKGLFKCRLIYSRDIIGHELKGYELRKINSLKLLFDDQIDYVFKYLDRPALDLLFQSKGDNDEILIVKNGLVTDAYYYNVVFQKDNMYYTPSSPLLQGVQRQFLLDSKIILKKKIKVSEISKFGKVHLINAMTPLNKLTIPIENIEY